MALLLDKFFKPKWRHDKPEVRLQALRGMDWDNPEQQRILMECLTSDPDPSVREQALRQVRSFKSLIDLTHHANESVRRAVAERLEQMIQESSPLFEEFLARQLGEVSAETLFALAAPLAGHSRFPALMQSLRETQPALALHLAVEHPASRVRLASAECLASASELEEVARRSKGRDKGVYQLAKTRLQALRQQERQAQQTAQSLQGLCEQLEALVVTEQLQHYSERLQVMRQQLQALDASVAPELAATAAAALSRCEARERIWLEAQQREAERLAQARARSDERTATLQTLQQAHDQLTDPEGTLPPLATLQASLDALLKTQETRWLEATRDEQTTRAEQKEYQHLMTELRQCHAAVQRVLASEDTLRAQLQAVQEAPDQTPMESLRGQQQALRESLRQIDWPSAFTAPPLLREVQEQLGHWHQLQAQSDASQRAVRQQARSLLDRLDAAVLEGSVREASLLFRELSRLLEQLPESGSSDLIQHLRLEQKRLDELRDWVRFATRPKQEDLIQRMEQLAAASLEPHVKAEKIRDLQREWKELGGSSDAAMWQRFKAASDAAYEPCKAFFSEENQLKAVNLARREEIVEQLTTYLDGVDWSKADWKAAEMINRQAREEWRRYFPVDHRKGRSVQERFNVQLQRLEEKLEGERQRNAAAKAAIVARAEGLLEQPDLRAATQEAKALQKAWQQVGLTDHRRDRELWKAFRQACDALFGRLQDQREAQLSASEAQQARAEEIVTALQRLADEAEAGSESVLNTYIDHFRELGPLGRQGTSVQQRFDQAVRACRQALRLAKSREQLQYWQGLLDEALRRRFAGATTPSAFHPGAEHATWLNTLESMTFEDTDPGTDTPDDALIWLEILAGVDSPDRHRARRMALQMERLATSKGSPVAEDADARLDALIRAWCGHPQLTPEAARENLPRVERVLQITLCGSE